MTRDEIAALRELAEKGTKVVGWYPYGDTDGTVRGPFFRWFKCSEVDPQYKNNVASITDECNWVAAALNNFARLLDEVESTQAKLSAAEKERDELTEHITRVNNKAAEQLDELREKLAVAVEALKEFRLGHEHQPDLPHTRAMGDSYGWCSICSEKVSWGPGYAEEALKAINGGE